MMLCRRLRKLPIDEKTGKVTMELGGYRNADESSTADYAWDSDCKRKSGKSAHCSKTQRMSVSQQLPSPTVSLILIQLTV